MSPRVLVVDDDVYLLRPIARSLSRAGFDVVTAGNADTALAMTATFDVVIADFHLKSNLTGADVVRHFKSQFGADVACFVLTGEDDAATRARCFEVGAAEVLLKPMSPSELRRRIAATLEAAAT